MGDQICSPFKFLDTALPFSMRRRCARLATSCTMAGFEEILAVEIEAVLVPVFGPLSFESRIFPDVVMPNRPSARIIALTLTCGSAMRPRSPHLGHVKAGEEMRCSNLVWCSMLPRESRSWTNIADGIASPHSRFSLPSTSGNHTLWESPAGIEDCSFIIPSGTILVLVGGSSIHKQNGLFLAECVPLPHGALLRRSDSQIQYLTDLGIGLVLTTKNEQALVRESHLA